MPIPLIESVGTYLEGSSAMASFGVPTGVSAGDIIIIPIYVDGVVATITDYADGFAEASNSPVPNASALPNTIHIVWKRAAGSDTGTYDFTLSTSVFRAGAALRSSGCVDTGSPWDSQTDSAIDANDGTTTPPVSVTTLGVNRLLVWVGSSWAANTWTPPTGFTERIDTGFGTVTEADKGQASVGSSGSVFGTAANSTKRSAWLGALIGAGSAVSGIVSVDLGSMSAGVVGVTDSSGSISCGLGGMSVYVVGSISSGVGPGGVVSGWWGLASIWLEGQQTRQELETRGPWACPNDGEPLVSGVNGVRFCRFDGWKYPDDWDGRV